MDINTMATERTVPPWSDFGVRSGYKCPKSEKCNNTQIGCKGAPHIIEINFIFVLLFQQAT